MKYIINTISVIITLPISATTVFTEDFSTTTLPGNTQARVGFFNGNATFGGIVADANSTIVNGALEVETTNNFRGIGILLGADDFNGAGDYTLEFDLVNFSGDSDDFARASVFSGSGFELANDRNALLLNAQRGTLEALGNTTVNLLNTEDFIVPSNDLNLTFNFDGSSAVAVFLGVETTNFPFPTATFDNISISETQSKFESIPEPSVALLLANSLFLMFRRKR